MLNFNNLGRILVKREGVVDNIPKIETLPIIPCGCARELWVGFPG